MAHNVSIYLIYLQKMPVDNLTDESYLCYNVFDFTDDKHPLSCQENPEKHGKDERHKIS